ALRRCHIKTKGVLLMLEKFSKKHAEENAQQDEKQKDLESTAAEADNTVADEDDDADLFACIKD
ncbi:hypothetical protein RFZ45_04780, partial [Acinetobacter baumannii]|nr:hypothetical protein [Acinetobacter baumannii]